jgi:hypothetical protein
LFKMLITVLLESVYHYEYFFNVALLNDVAIS